MDIRKRLSKSTIKLNVLLIVLILILLVLIIGLFKVICYLLNQSIPFNRYEYPSEQYVCIEEVFEKYRERWNEECRNLPDDLKVNPNPRDMEYGFACGLPPSIATELDKSKELLEEECTKLEK
jgi:hypothetical protein